MLPSALLATFLHLSCLGGIHAWGTPKQSFEDWYKETGAELDASCNDSWCTSSDAQGGVDCVAAAGFERATCSQGSPRYAGGGGYLYLVSGMPLVLIRYSCCTEGEGDMTLGWESNFDATCSDTFCTSDDGKGGTDCYTATNDGKAGMAPMEKCTCSRGEARLSTFPFISVRSLLPLDIYKYSCCESGDNDGETCGFHDPLEEQAPPALVEEAAPMITFSQSPLLLGSLLSVLAGAMVVAAKRRLTSPLL